jgi:hypothetical protein
LLLAVALATRTDERFRERRRQRREAAGKVKPPSDDDKKEPWSARILARGSTPIVFVAGLVVNVPGAAYLVGLKDIAAGKYSTGEEIALIVGFNLIMFLLAEIPLAGLLSRPSASTRWWRASTRGFRRTVARSRSRCARSSASSWSSAASSTPDAGGDDAAQLAGGAEGGSHGRGRGVEEHEQQRGRRGRRSAPPGGAPTCSSAPTFRPRSRTRRPRRRKKRPRRRRRPPTAATSGRRG